jgi:hypothetical protein
VDSEGAVGNEVQHLGTLLKYSQIQLANLSAGKQRNAYQCAFYSRVQAVGFPAYFTFALLRAVTAWTDISIQQ